MRALSRTISALSGGRRGGGRPAAALRNAAGLRVVQVDPLAESLRQARHWRDRLNPLRGLTPARVTQWIEAGETGAHADIQWLYKWIEDEDPILSALVERRISALSALDWDIRVPDDLPAGMAETAEAQARALRGLYDGIRGFRGALEWLEMAAFRGFAHLEKIVDPARPHVIRRLERIPQWHWVQDGSAGAWEFAVKSPSGATRGEAVDAGGLVVRVCDRPIDRKAARSYTLKNLSVKDWMGYLEIYGIPAMFAIMPDGVSPEQQDEFQRIVERIMNDARGTLPHGSDIKSVAGGSNGPDPFQAAVEWLDSQLVIAGTGGLLTMLTAPGSGTLAGSAHMEAFELIAKRSAAGISEVCQDAIDRPFLAAEFPGAPALAYFQLAAQEENDTGEVVEQVATLSGAGYETDPDQVAEKTGYRVRRKEAPADPPAQSPPPAAAPVANAAPPREAGAATAEGDDAAETEDSALNEARGQLAKALNADFAMVKERLEALLNYILTDDTDEETIRNMAEAAGLEIDKLLEAEPGTTEADRAMEDIIAAALLDGWTRTETGEGTP